MGSSETTGSAGVDFINDPDLRIRDLSHTGSRMRQLVDLTKGSFFDMGFGPRNGDSDSYAATVDEEWPRDRLEIYIKEKPRGPRLCLRHRLLLRRSARHCVRGSDQPRPRT